MDEQLEQIRHRAQLARGRIMGASKSGNRSLEQQGRAELALCKAEELNLRLAQTFAEYRRAAEAATVDTTP